MSLYYLRYFALSLILANVYAKKCQEVEPVNDFQVEKSLGIWYTVGSDPNKYDINMKCIKINFMTADSNAIHIEGSSIITLYNDIFKFNITSKFVKDPTVADFAHETIKLGQKNVLYTKIIATDYDTYQIFYGCNKDNGRENLWVFSRERNVNDEFWQKINEIIKSKDISEAEFHLIDQENCTN